MYAWYLDNTYVPVMENEMAILHLQEKTLIPHQVQEFKRKKALVDFFRETGFQEWCIKLDRLSGNHRLTNMSIRYSGTQNMCSIMVRGGQRN